MSDIEIAASQINRDVVESKALLGRECITCFRILEYKFFKKDSSYRDGWRDQCQVCESAPVMSTDEHTHRLREQNYSNHAVRAQRWAHQDDYRDDAAREGRRMAHAELIFRLQKLVPDLYITEGRIIGDLAIYRVYGTPQPHLDGMTFEYLFYMPTGMLPEFSQYEFDTVRDIPIKEKKRGWRTILLRLIRTGLLTEERAHAEFGPALGAGATVYNRKLWEFRNQQLASS